MKVDEILHVITSECEHGCTDAESTKKYFRRFYNSRADQDVVAALADSINYDKLRENQRVIYNASKQ